MDADTLDLEVVIDLAADYHIAPEDLHLYRWFEAPNGARQVVYNVAFPDNPLLASSFEEPWTPATEVRHQRAMVSPLVEDRHAGVSFCVGWDVQVRIATVFWGPAPDVA